MSKRKFAGAQLLALATVFLAVQTAGALAEKPRYAAMVIDANTGKVLHESAADEPRYPASLTKMMTLYLVFEELARGKLSYKTPITMSKSAAEAPPSKLGLDPGETIAVIDAIKALVTKSANDVAVAVAEHIAGSEAAFARRMTERARQIGMRSSKFYNASGLPDSRQVTTARDMLTLALRLYDDFPDQFRLFSLRSFTYRGKTYGTHNTLMKSFEGMDGIKTGYTRASGFNVVTSVRSKGLHIVGAVFGGSTSASRNSQMRFLLRRAMVDASKEVTRKKSPMLVAAPAPAPRPAKKVAAAPPPAPPAPAPKAPPAARPAQARPSPAAAAVPAVEKKPAASPAPATPPPMAAPETPVQIVRVRPVPVPVADERSARPPAAKSDAAMAETATGAPQPTMAGASPRIDLEALGSAVARSRAASQAALPPAPAPAPTAPPAPTETVAAKSTGTSRLPGRPPSTLNDQLALMTEQPNAVSVPPPMQVRASAPMPAPASPANPLARPPSTLQQQAAALNGAPAQGTRMAAGTRRPEPAWRLRGPVIETAATSEGYEVEIGVFPTAEAAERRLEQAKAAAPDLRAHAGLALPLQNGKRLLYRARFTSFEQASAAAACNELRRHAFDCSVTVAR